jgi:hypothetical protein
MISSLKNISISIFFVLFFCFFVFFCFFLLISFSATISTLIGGFIADKVNKKIIVAVSSIIMSIAIGLTLIPYFQRLDVILGMACIFGLGIYI